MTRRASLFLTAVLLAAVTSLWLGRPAATDPSAAPDAPAGADAALPAGTQAAPGAGQDASAPVAGTRAGPRGEAADAGEAGALLVRDVVVRDLDGRVAWRGDVDLAPVLARIAAGERDPHRNDGGVFGNREGLLPEHERGYYREYVVRTPGIAHAGPQRVILGEGGELYYTSDHYASFRRIR